ncbi:MAG: hypothetical protein JOZ18_18055 [Chloroflexi bacterium]|nr:hypothetical protein [Chloroflexota bacterium]
MQEHQKTGLLHADVPSGVASLREPCHVEISIMAGAIASCSIIGNSGRRVIEKKALQELSRLGRLRWTFTPQQEIVVQQVSPAPAPVEISLFPWRTAQVEQWQMRNWSRMHKAVFALADGTKNITKIAGILSTSPDMIDKVLGDLQKIGVITMGPQNEKKHSGYLDH